MDSSSSMGKQVQPIVRKGKKKQVKDELDRIKQPEKKKRRPEKAIATSVAIRAELEKKKQKKKEGQQEATDEEKSADAAKKEQEKDELERIKQAEKKKFRIEKPIANSAAIRAELEKKKLKNLEEQRRLDEEGAAIAEAVALHVLLGEDCVEDSYRNAIFSQVEETDSFLLTNAAAQAMRFTVTDQVTVTGQSHMNLLQGDGITTWEYQLV